MPNISLKENRLNSEKLNYQGCLMKVVEYCDAANIVVEFQDDYKTNVHTDWRWFEQGRVKNPYHPTVCEKGIIGNKYTISKNGVHTKEYKTWKAILGRSFSKNIKEKGQTYMDITCCDEWLLYENFYEWLHQQENFEQWLNGDRWAIDKDILIKGNKIYSPNTCCLVPQRVNNLFIKSDAVRGDLPIGVYQITNSNSYGARSNTRNGRSVHLGAYPTQEEAFQVYKEYKEKIIKQIAQEEFIKSNITKKCYEAMMNYEVEIID